MSISLDQLSSLSSIQEGKDQSADKLQGSLKKDLSKATDQELMDVCKDFESYFTEQVFKAMEKMVPKEESSGSMGQMKEYYQEELISQYAKDSSEGEGMGIAKLLYEQMKRNYQL